VHAGPAALVSTMESQANAGSVASDSNRIPSADRIASRKSGSEW
jgi:hypothetical protein